ncbi:MAG: hypothetical protein AAFV33_16745 [Chloroflexota bacterium]
MKRKNYPPVENPGCGCGIALAWTFIAVLTGLLMLAVWSHNNRAYSLNIVKRLEQEPYLQSDNVTVDGVWELLDDRAYRRLDCQHVYYTLSGTDNHAIACDSPSHMASIYPPRHVLDIVAELIFDWSHISIKFRFNGDNEFLGFSHSYQWHFYI